MTTTDPVETTETPQEPTDEAVQPEEPVEPDGAVKALRAEREARKAAEAEARRLADEAATRERTDALAAIGAEHGFTEHQIKFVRGDTPEEMAANAAELAAAFAPDPGVRSKPRTDLFSPMSDRDDPPRDMGRVADQIRNRPLS